MAGETIVLLFFCIPLIQASCEEDFQLFSQDKNGKLDNDNLWAHQSKFS